MELYTIAKFLHVGVAAAWIGGAFSPILLGVRAVRARDDQDLMAVIRHVVSMAGWVFMPAPILMFLLGLYLTWTQWSFGDAWVVLALIGVLATGGIGGAVLTPLSKVAATAPGVAPTPEAMAAGRKLLRLAAADNAMLLVVVFDMVAKPAWSDWGVILAMLLVVAGAFALVLRKRA